MADNGLIYPIGFDLEAGIKAAEKNADVALRKLQTALERKPLSVPVTMDASKFAMFERQFSNSINGIQAKLAQAQRLWNSMTFDVKFDESGNLSRRAQIVFDAFNQLTQASATMGQRLGEVNRQLAQSEAETARLITAEYDKRKRQIDEQIRLKERQAAAEERVRQSQLKGVNVGYVDLQKQTEAVRNLRLQYEAILPMLNALAQKRVDIKVSIDKQFEADINRINAEIARLRQSNLQLGAKGDANAIQANLAAIRQLEAELQRISQQKIDLLNTNKINSDISRLRTEIASVFGDLQSAERKLAADNSLNAALDAQSQKVLNLHAQIQKLDQQVAQLNAQGKMYNADGSFSSQATTLLQQRIALTKQLEQAAVTGQQAQIKLEQQLREEKRRTDQEAKQAAKEAERQAKAEAAARKQAIEAANAENKARQAAYNARRKQGLETQRILQKEAKSIADITAQLQIQQQRLNTANVGSAKFNKIAEEVKRLTAELDKANQKMRELTGQTTSGAAKQATAVRQVSNEYKHQDGYISRLIKRLAVYAGFRQISNFLTSVREVTAQFELQRVSLGAIIQDQTRANALFSEIKQFALKSPISIMDLTKYTKQVAAYKIETDKLFDTTKRLADVSVGLGVDMGRIVLAYGQVKAASFLRGCLGVDTEILTTNGIKKVQDIQVGDKLLNEKNEIVTVQELIRGREQMYRVTQSNGMEYRVNENHILTLYKDGALHDVYVKDAIADAGMLGVRYFEGELITSPITIEKDIVDDYYGFVLDGNKRFQLGDGTVTHNTEIRQFTEAGIPMLELLAEKFTELNGEAVTTEQVMEMVSKRMVSFSMVEDIFNDMTSAGGMFYNMQEKQGNTLFGLWAKLGDAASMMYDEIGNTESVNEGMKSLIELLTDLMRNWKATGAALSAVGLLGGTTAAATKFVKYALSSSRKQAADAAATAATRAREAAVLQLNRAIEKGSVDDINAATATLNKAKADEVAARKATTKTGLLVSGLKSVAKSLAVGLGIGIAIAAVTTLVYKLVEASEKANRLKNELADIKSKTLTEMSTAVNNFNSLANAAVNAADGSKEQRDALDELKRTYKDIIPEQNLTITKLREMKGNYEALTQAIKENIAQQKLQESVNAIQEDYGGKLKDARNELREYLTELNDGETFGERQAERITENFERFLEQGLTRTVALRKALSLEGKEYGAMADSLLSKASGPARQFSATLEAMHRRIKGVTDEFADFTGELGRYETQWKTMLKLNEAITITAPDNSFAASEQMNKQKLGNLFNYFLKPVMGEDIWNQFAGEVRENAEALPEVFWKALDNAAQSPAQRNAIARVRKAYEQIIPSDETVRVFRDKLEKIAAAQKFSMDEARKYYMSDGESLKDYRKRLQEEYDGIIENIVKYEVTKKALLAAGESTAKQDELLEAAKKEAAFLMQILSQLPTFPTRSDSGRPSDNRLSVLQEMVSTLKQVNKEYDELAKKEGTTRALADTQEKYANTFKYLQSLATKYKFNLPDFGVPTDAAALTKYLEAIKAAMANLPKSEKAKSEKAVLSLETDIADIKMDDAQKKIEAELNRLADRISRTKTAKEFYNKILSQTGDIRLAATLSFAVHGQDGAELNKRIREQIEKLVEGTSATLDVSVFRADGTLDPKKLREFAEAQADALGGITSSAYKELIKLSDDAEKDFQKTIEGWLKAVEKAKSYSDKMLDLARTTNNEIARINTEKGHAQTRITELLGMGNLNEGGKKELAELQNFLSVADGLIQGFKDKQAQEQTKLAYEAFKDSPMYVQMFGDLEHTSTQMLENMRTRITQLQSAWNGLDPTQLKELQSRLNEIDEQLARRNPFSALAKGIKDYNTLRKNGDSRGNKSKRSAEKDLMAASKETEAAATAYQTLLEKYGDGTEEGTRKLVESNKEVADAKQKLDEAMRDEKAAQKAVENWKKVEKAIKLSATELFSMLNWAGDIAHAVADISEAMGADEEDVQYWNDIGDALSDISGGIQDIVNAAMSVNVVDLISSVLTAVPKMFVGFANLFSAGTIRKANKEIKKQEEILEDLEYTYGRLQKVIEKTFGDDYIRNFGKQLENLQARAEAYRKQAEAERSKGKKADDAKVKEYENSYRETVDEIADMQGQVAERMLGTDITSAARDFAKAWLDARLSFASTTDAIKGKFKDMINSMIIEGTTSRLVQAALQGFYDDIEEMYKAGKSSDEVAAYALSQVDGVTEDITGGLEVWYQGMLARGIDLNKALSQTEGEYTGIKRDIAGASEETMSSVAVIGNTLMYYVSPIPTISENVAAMRALMDGGSATSVPAQTAGWTDWQQQAMDTYTAIQRNTAETVVECRNIAAYCKAMAEDIHRVVKPKNTSGSHGVQVYM